LAAVQKSFYAGLRPAFFFLISWYFFEEKTEYLSYYFYLLRIHLDWGLMEGRPKGLMRDWCVGRATRVGRVTGPAPLLCCCRRAVGRDATAPNVVTVVRLAPATLHFFRQEDGQLLVRHPSTRSPLRR
jgi:hypothetical protein